MPPLLSSWYWWESMIMLRKLGVSAVVVFMATYDVGSQMLVIMAVIMIAMAAQVGGPGLGWKKLQA